MSAMLGHKVSRAKASCSGASGPIKPLPPPIAASSCWAAAFGSEEHPANDNRKQREEAGYAPPPCRPAAKREAHLCTQSVPGVISDQVAAV